MKFLFPNSFLKVLTIFCLGLFLTSCSQHFTIVPSGNIKEGIKFEFYNYKNHADMIELKVGDVTLEKKANNQWERVWSIWGEGKFSSAFLKNIKYGEIPTGLVEQIKPKKLEAGQTYRVMIDGLPSSGPIAYGGEVFIINEDGEAIIIKRPNNS